MVKAAGVQQRRTRDLVADIDRLVPAYDAQRSDRIARDRRITFAKREARRLAERPANVAFFARSVLTER